MLKLPVELIEYRFDLGLAEDVREGPLEPGDVYPFHGILKCKPLSHQELVEPVQRRDAPGDRPGGESGGPEGPQEFHGMFFRDVVRLPDLPELQEPEIPADVEPVRGDRVARGILFERQKMKVVLAVPVHCLSTSLSTGPGLSAGGSVPPGGRRVVFRRGVSGYLTRV